MSDNVNLTGDFDDEMAEYLQTFLDETEEQLDDLVETMLALEESSTNTEELNEAFRLIHSIKGSAGMMGLDSITVLTHQLENRFERFRSGTEQLDEPTMNLVLRCIDFLRQCNGRLRDGEHLASPAELLDELRNLEKQSEQTPGATVASPSEDAGTAPVPAEMDEPDAGDPPPSVDLDDGIVQMVVTFRAGLQLADLKARLIMNRLAGLGELKATHPNVDSLAELEQVETFSILIETDVSSDRLRAAADVDGVESIEFAGAEVPSAESEPDVAVDQPEPASVQPPEEHTEPDAEQHEPQEAEQVVQEAAPDESRIAPAGAAVELAEPPPVSPPGPWPELAPPEIDVSPGAVSAEPSEQAKSIANVAETMRVDIGRLDNLMNLTGELVVNRARFEQLSTQISPGMRKASSLNRIREFCDGLRNILDALDNDPAPDDQQQTLVKQLRGGLKLIDEQSEVWEQDRHQLEKFSEAIDQLSRVSGSLQKGVLDTRMVPVGPLFTRFKRVVRDLSKERGKQVNLVIRGEKTELDKRMIDELGDPLVHLVRNSIDHGMESPDVRVAGGKPELGTIVLEATHSGNNVYVHVQDDGAGIDVARIKAKLSTQRLLSDAAIGDLSDEQALDYIWHPGFSTAKEVTDVSGRGVGMDVVRERIRKLNGSIEVESDPGEGTHFTLRLPLTLAIINCLLVRLRGVVFSMPIDDVREIVSVSASDVITVQGKHAIDIRDKYIPLVGIDDIFHWNQIEYGRRQPTEIGGSGEKIDVVILQSGGKTLGIRVEHLLGSRDIVVKSLSDNFMDIHGLSGASILGDGTVCLMLDIGAVFQLSLATENAIAREGMMN